MQAASIALAIQGDKVLWVKRRDFKIWVLPGGGIDSGESPENAVLRELKEETGKHASILRKAALLRPKNCLASPTHLFICTLENPDRMEKETEEAIEIGFFPIENPPEPHFPLHQDWIGEIMSKKEYFERDLTEITPVRIILFLLRHPFLTFHYLWWRLWLRAS